MKILNSIKKTNINADKSLFFIAVCYVVFPVILFFLGWFKWPVALLCCGVVLIMGRNVYREVIGNCSISIKENHRYWFMSLGLIALWILISGIGYFSQQSGDFWARNALYRELCLSRWPVYNDLTLEPEYVQALTGGHTSALYVYYFTWWLVPALFAKTIGYFGGPSVLEISSRLAIYLWAVLGAFLVLYCLTQYIGKYSYWIVSALMLFGGMDFVIYLLKHLSIPTGDAGTVETYANYFQYSSNTTLVYWVFNQTITVWLIISIFLLLKTKRSAVGWGSLVLSYGPFPMIGMVPVILYSVFSGSEGSLLKKIRSAVSFDNVAGAFVILLTYGSFYLTNHGSGLTNNTGFALSLHREFRTITLLCIFNIAEVWIYYIVMGNEFVKYRFSKLVLIVLSLWPLYSMGTYNEWTMRGSIPALFLLMTVCLKYVCDEVNEASKIKALKIVLVLGFLTSLSEIRLHVAITMVAEQGDYIIDPVYSLSYIKADDDFKINTIIGTYWVYEDIYENSFYVKYLARGAPE